MLAPGVYAAATLSCTAMCWLKCPHHPTLVPVVRVSACWTKCPRSPRLGSVVRTLLPCGERLYKLLVAYARWQQMSTYFMRICLHWILVLGMHWCTYLAYNSYLNYLVCLVTQKYEGFTPYIRHVCENVWSMGMNPCMIWACVYLNNLMVACISQPISTKLSHTLVLCSL